MQAETRSKGLSPLEAVSIGGMALIVLVVFGMPFVAWLRGADTTEQACRKDAGCWAEHNLVAAQAACTPAIEEKAHRRYRWTSGMLGSIFSASHAVSAGNDVLEYAGDSIEVADGSGGWQQMHYFCTFDSKAGTVRAVSFEKGDIPDE